LLPVELIERAYDVVDSFFDDRREGPIPSMYLLVRLLNRLSSAEDETLHFTALNFNGDNVIVKGRVLYLRDIRDFVENIIGEVKELIRNHLFFGLEMFDIDWSPGVVHEEPRNRSVGYSCFLDPKNSFRKHRFDLLQAILTHPLLCGRFHYVGKNGQIVWKASACFAYMEVCHNVEMLLFSGTQTSVGEPAQTTEIASQLIGNVGGGGTRNVLVMFQFLCMMGTYKTGHLTERDIAMMRVPHPEIGRLWMLYITFVRPVLVIWQKYFGGRRAAMRARDRLFFGPHRPVTPSELSRSLSRHTQRLLNIKISISLWRHIVTWFLNCVSARLIDFNSRSYRSALAFQSGHGEGAHSLYAGDARLPAGIDFHDFFRSMCASGTWHDLVGFSQSHLLEAMNCAPSRKRIMPPVDPSVPGGSLPPINTGKIAEDVKKMILPDLIHAISQSRANDLAFFLDGMGVNVQSPPSQALTQPVSHMMHPSRLADLRTFLGDDSATFKDPQQALALELISEKHLSILLIGPTGEQIP
jgi:hypothetical protein